MGQPLAGSRSLRALAPGQERRDEVALRNGLLDPTTTKLQSLLPEHYAERGNSGWHPSARDRELTPAETYPRLAADARHRPSGRHPGSRRRLAVRYPEIAEMQAQTETIFGPVWVWLAFGEAPAAPTLIGGSVILTAVASMAAASSAAPAEPAKLLSELRGAPSD